MKAGLSIYAHCIFCLCFLAHGRELWGSYIQDANMAKEGEKYDYIVVGGGTTGCPLAATLSKHFSVLLLERGGEGQSPSIDRLEGFPSVVTTPAAQRFRSVEGVRNIRANVLGGGSAINAGFYSRAPPEFIRRAGWNAKKVHKAYEWVESKIVFGPTLGPWNSALRDGLMEADILPYNGANLDHLVGTKIGKSLFDESGNRHTAAELLRTGNATNLRVYVHATVQSIIFDKTSSSADKNKLVAKGVAFSDSEGNLHNASVNVGGEVILSAGAIGTPQLLMLSGVGPTEELQKFDIPVSLELPTLGRNITDTPVNSLLVLSPQPVEASVLEVAGITPYGNIIEGASGGNHSMYLFSAGDITTLPPSDRSDNLASIADTIVRSLPDPLRQELNQAGFLLHKVYEPESRGYLGLGSRDIRDSPIVRFNYFSTRKDIETCINGTRYMHKLLNTSAFSSFRYSSVPLLLRMIAPELGSVVDGQFDGAYPSLPDPGDFTQASQWCKNTMSVICHYHGGCHVGSCVDKNYKLKGVGSLRVVDGSTWFTSPGTNPMATCLMLGRYVGLKILDERGHPE